MDYFNDVLAMFPSIDGVSILLSMRVRKLTRNILIFVLKMNEGLTGCNEGE